MSSLACVSDPQQFVEGSSDAALPGTGGAGGSTVDGQPLGSGGAVGTGGATRTSTVAGTGGAGGAGGTQGAGGVRGPDAGTPNGTGGMGGMGGTGGRTGAGGGVSVVDGGGTTGSVPDGALEGPRSDAASADRGPSSDAPPATTDGSGADGLSAAAQEYVKAFAEPFCARLLECCAQLDLPTSGFGPCEARELSFVKHLDDGSTVMDMTAIQTVLAQLEESCDQPSYALLASTTKGTRAEGEPCVAVDQCAGEPALCLFSSGGTNGKCMTPPRGKLGDACSVTCDDATLCKWGTSGGKSPYSACYEEDGLRCDTQTYTCVALAAPGQTCDDFSDCGTHADCRNGSCQAKAPLGADCSNGLSCDRMLQCTSDGASTYTCKRMSVAWSGSCTP